MRRIWFAGDLTKFDTDATADDASQLNDKLRSALLVVLDHVDYTNGARRMNEMVGAVLPKEVISLARAALAQTQEVKHG